MKGAPFCGTIRDMKLAVFAAFVCLLPPLAEAAQNAASRSPQPAAPDRRAQAYEEFLIARHLSDGDDVNGAIAAFKRAMEFDPSAADIPAELAALYMQQNRAEEA